MKRILIVCGVVLVALALGLGLGLGLGLHHKNSSSSSGKPDGNTDGGDANTGNTENNDYDVVPGLSYYDADLLTAVRTHYVNFTRPFPYPLQVIHSPSDGLGIYEADGRPTLSCDASAAKTYFPTPLSAKCDYFENYGDELCDAATLKALGTAQACYLADKTAATPRYAYDVVALKARPSSSSSSSSAAFVSSYTNGLTAEEEAADPSKNLMYTFPKQFPSTSVEKLVYKAAETERPSSAAEPDKSGMLFGDTLQVPLTYKAYASKYLQVTSTSDAAVEVQGVRYPQEFLKLTAAAPVCETYGGEYPDNTYSNKLLATMVPHEQWIRATVVVGNPDDFSNAKGTAYETYTFDTQGSLEVNLQFLKAVSVQVRSLYCVAAYADHKTYVVESEKRWEGNDSYFYACNWLLSPTVWFQNDRVQTSNNEGLFVEYHEKGPTYSPC